MKKIESGRSMIEMLGVLAIIGVLSIGGLAGYTMAMNRWRANTLTDYVTRCVVVSQTSNMTGAPAFGDGTTAAKGKCADILKEAIPGFLTGTGKNVYISNYTKNNDETTVKAQNVSDAVGTVLTEKMGTRVNGVKVTYASNVATFSFMNSTTS